MMMITMTKMKSRQCKTFWIRYSINTIQ